MAYWLRIGTRPGNRCYRMVLVMLNSALCLCPFRGARLWYHGDCWSYEDLNARLWVAGLSYTILSYYRLDSI